MTEPLPLTRRHHQRLREMHRSAGWPCHDAIEVELIAAGFLQREFDGAGREHLRVSDAGIGLLARAFERNRGALSAHEALVQRVAREQLRAGRLVRSGLALRAPLPREGEPLAHHWPATGCWPARTSIPSAAVRAPTGWSRWCTRSR